MYTLDTNSIIYYLKDDPNAIKILEGILNQSLPTYISTITELELFSFSKLTTEEFVNIDEILKSLSIIPLDSQIARLAASLRCKFKLKTPDSVIAATALFTGSILVTRNVKDFLRVTDLQVKSI